MQDKTTPLTNEEVKYLIDVAAKLSEIWSYYEQDLWFWTVRFEFTMKESEY